MAEYAAWTQPADKETAYVVGDRVEHTGFVWESLVDANVLEPVEGGKGWRQVAPVDTTPPPPEGEAPASPVRDAALAALAVARDEQATEHAQRVDVLTDQARAVLAGLPAPDGTTPLATVVGQLAAEHVDLTSGLVILTDGTVALAVGADSSVRLVELVDGAWTERSSRLDTLVELAEVLAQDPEA